MTPRVYAITAWVVAPFAIAQAALLVCLLMQIGSANDAVARVTRRAGVLEGEVTECILVARSIRDLHIECAEQRALTKSRLSALEERCGL